MQAGRLHHIKRFGARVGWFALLMCAGVALALALAACGEEEDFDASGADGNANAAGARDEAETPTPDGDDDSASAGLPPKYVVESATPEGGGDEISLVAYGVEPMAGMDALMQGRLAVSNGCLGVQSEFGDEFTHVVWPYGYTVDHEDDGVAVLLNADGDVVARDGDLISMGGGNAPDSEGTIEAIAPEGCGADSYWFSSSEVRRMTPANEPDPAIDNGLTAYFPQWESEDENTGGQGGGRLVLENGCLYADPEVAGEPRVIIWPPDYSVEADGEDVVVLDGNDEEIARSGDIIEAQVRNGQFDMDEYGIPGDCQGMHSMFFDLEVVGGPDDEIEGPHVQSPEEALEQDAQMYAEEHGISLEEAKRRLELQQLPGPLQQALMENEADRFGGLYIEHEPEFRVVVLMTDGDEATVRGYIDDPELDEIVEVDTVEVSYYELQDIQNQAVSMLQDLGAMFSAGINVQENQVEIYVPDAAQLEEALEAAGHDLPEYVVINEQEQPETLDDDG